LSFESLYIYNKFYFPMLSLLQEFLCKTFVILPGVGGRMGIANWTSPFSKTLVKLGIMGTYLDKFREWSGE